jgi:APA family basic amino acid/polyamine antiporter
MLQACTSVFFANIGFDAVTAVAQEAKDPTRSLPIAILATVVVSVLIYVGISTVMVGLVSYKLLDTDNPLSTAV